MGDAVGVRKLWGKQDWRALGEMLMGRQRRKEGEAGPGAAALWASGRGQRTGWADLVKSCAWVV